MKILGTSRLRKLTGVKANPWNPNRMTDFQMESLKHGLIEDGWIAAQAMLVWGKDDQGKSRMIIIDGEHRWLAAVELGFDKVPMVVLDGLTETEAKALTIKLDSKRGQFDKKKLGTLVRELEVELPELGLSLGFEENYLESLLHEPEPVPAAAPVEVVHSENAHTKTVPLYMSHEDYERFMHDAGALGKEWSSNISDTVLRSIELALAE